MKKVDRVLDLFATPATPEKVQALKSRRVIDLSVADTCSLQCPYCVTSKHLRQETREEGLLQRLGLGRYLERLEAVFGNYFPLNVTLPGSGEPTESPYFEELAAFALDMGGRLKIQTNLSRSDRIEKLAARYPREDLRKRIALTVSYHVGAFLDLPRGEALRKRFLEEHFPRVVRTGCTINTVRTPMTPGAIVDSRLVEDYHYMHSLRSFEPSISELYGQYREKPYPASYTPAERDGLIDKTRTLSYDIFSRGTGRRSGGRQVEKQNSRHVENLTRHLELKGAPCLMPVMHVAVNARGDVTYCNSVPRRVICNIESADPSEIGPIFTEGAVPCPANQCSCSASGNGFCLRPHNLSMPEYYYAWYRQQGRPEIAALFDMEGNSAAVSV